MGLRVSLSRVAVIECMGVRGVGCSTRLTRRHLLSHPTPTLVPGPSYFKDHAQRRHLDRLNRKRAVRGRAREGLEGCSGSGVLRESPPRARN
jgi:hypothetical protein